MGATSVRISITNQVSGLTEQAARHAFEPFWRGDQARASNGKNAGLGLTLCRKVIEVLGGTIEVSCVGSDTFRVDLQLIDDTQGPATS